MPFLNSYVMNSVQNADECTNSTAEIAHDTQVLISSAGADACKDMSRTLYVMSTFVGWRACVSFNTNITHPHLVTSSIHITQVFVKCQFACYSALQRHLQSIVLECSPFLNMVILALAVLLALV